MRDVDPILTRDRMHASAPGLRPRYIAALLLLAVIAACAAIPVATSAAPALSDTTVRVPRLIGRKLPLAELLLRRAGLRVGREDCDCTFGVVIKSNWYVCMQWPRPGKLVRRGSRVATYSVRDMVDC